MPDLVGNTDDRFSYNTAHMKKNYQKQLLQK